MYQEYKKLESGSCYEKFPLQIYLLNSPEYICVNLFITSKADDFTTNRLQQCIPMRPVERFRKRILLKLLLPQSRQILKWSPEHLFKKKKSHNSTKDYLCWFMISIL